jgi:hypothetical protein
VAIEGEWKNLPHLDGLREINAAAIELGFRKALPEAFDQDFL